MLLCLAPSCFSDGHPESGSSRMPTLDGGTASSGAEDDASTSRFVLDLLPASVQIRFDDHSRLLSAAVLQTHSHCNRLLCMCCRSASSLLHVASQHTTLPARNASWMPNSCLLGPIVTAKTLSSCTLCLQRRGSRA